MPDSLKCPGVSQCKAHRRMNRNQSLALFFTVGFISISWGLVVLIEKRAPTLFEVAFSVTAVVGLLTEKADFKSVAAMFHGKGDNSQ